MAVRPAIGAAVMASVQSSLRKIGTAIGHGMPSAPLTTALLFGATGCTTAQTVDGGVALFGTALAHWTFRHRKAAVLETTPPAQLPEPETLQAAWCADRFYNKAPLEWLATAHSRPLHDILAKGVVSFERTIYRTAVNVRCWNQGYDCVHYAIQCADGTACQVLAYRQHEQAWELPAMGTPDPRPLFIRIAVAQSTRNMALCYSYQDGESMVDPISVEAALAATMLRDFIKESVNNRGLFPLTSPDAVIVL